MYDIKTIKKALKLLEQYDYQFTKVSRELGIPRTTLRLWRKKQLNGEPLLKHSRNKHSKWSDEYKNKILNYYFSHGKNMMITYRKFGEPSYSMIKRWVNEDNRYKKRTNKKPVVYNENIKKEILIETATRDGSVAEIAAKHNVTRETIYGWQNELAGGSIMNDKEKTKEELITEIEKLKKSIKNSRWKIRF